MKMSPNTENWVSAHLRQLAVESCAKANVFSSIVDSDFINKVYCMIGSGAVVVLKESSHKNFTLNIEGIRVVVNKEGKFQATYDPSSIATIDVRDCGNKMLLSFGIGEYNFQQVFDGRRSGEIFSVEGIAIMRQMIELAHDVLMKYESCQLRIA